jgi:hypothetical protein
MSSPRLTPRAPPPMEDRIIDSPVGPIWKMQSTTSGSSSITARACGREQDSDEADPTMIDDVLEAEANVAGKTRGLAGGPPRVHT